MDLEKKLNNGDFVTLAEFIPPKGTDISPLVENAGRIKDSVDAVSLHLPPKRARGNAEFGGRLLPVTVIARERGTDSDRLCFCQRRPAGIGRGSLS